MRISEYNGETNPVNSEYHNEEIVGRVEWNAKGLKITRMRMISDSGFPFWDISYCHGILNGKKVEVILPFSQLSKFGWKGEIINYAKRQGIYAKGLGILDNVSTLI